MRNKGAIRLFAILLALVCIYQMSFTWKTYKVNKDAEEYAQGDLVKENFYLDSMASEVIYNFLWVREFTFRECKEREINLGLDLKGGMNVTLEVSVVDVIKALSNYSKDTTFINSINLAKKLQQDSQEDFVTLFGKAFETIDPNGKLAAIFATVELKDRINYNSTNEEVLNVIRKETDDAIDNSFNILRNRIDRFGVTQPNIQHLEISGQILVELPGVKEPERVKKLLQGTAQLEFWETYENKEVYQYLLDANEKIKQMQETSEEEAQKEDTVIEKTSSDKPKDEIAEETSEDKLIVDEIDKSDTTTVETSLLEQLESDSLSTDSIAPGTDQLLKDYPLFSVLKPRVNNQGQLLGGAAVGWAHHKDIPKVDEYLNLKQVKALFPRNLKFLWSIKAFDKEENYYELIAIKITSRDSRPALEGDVITNARAEFGQSSANSEISMSMNNEGAKIWARLTKENKGRQIAIVLDDYVYSSPVVQNEIKGGRSSITGQFSVAEAKDLANILKSGKLPAPAKIIQEAIVGPSLGKEAINSGLWSFVIAFIIVLLYMIFYYNRAGWVADLALIANVFFIIGIMASLGAVLTLPGMAGIILTIGMSVDANVLIYERIKEELTAGKGLKLAISDGYKNAYSSIIDANVTTLLTAIILAYFGKGPIQGFATTLIIGILTSLFSAIFITRLIYERMLDKNKKITFATALTKNAFKNINFNFLGKRKVFYSISLIFILIGIVSLFTRGLNYGVDFTGGRTYQVMFSNSVSTENIQQALKDVYGEAPEVVHIGGDNQVKITTQYYLNIDEPSPEDIAEIAKQGINIDDPSVDDIVDAKLYLGLKSIIGDNVDFKTFLSDFRRSSQKIGPTIADDIKVSAVYAILFSIIIIFFYIFIRFKNWQFGLGAVAALIHDALLVVGLFSIFYGFMPFSLEIDQAFIAAILTVVGYSINDTVVVFDRVREYLGLYKKRERSEIINSALNSTLSRTFSTSLSTFVVLLTIFIFGGEVIRGFTFALMIGIIVGTYSSLFIASPIVYDTVKGIAETKRVLKGKKKR
ncbi:MAG: protein translocase subunit SecDF [Bacteroidales bacterium]|nr:protein translocase subunit SecDF [Bacteroidales bacterium]